MALAMAMGVTALPLTASARDIGPQWMASADTNKDGMVSRQEFLDMMAKRYDEEMAKMKKMPADQMGKMMKGDMLTLEGLRHMQIGLFSEH
jgi:hypothetical protein